MKHCRHESRRCLQQPIAHPCPNCRCAPSPVKVVVPCFPRTCDTTEFLAREIVVEIVDMDSSRFHKVQQARFSKLLNLQMRQRGAHLCPRRIPASCKNALFSTASVSMRCGRLVEPC